MLGRSARAAFPEIEGQGFFELLDQVHATGAAVTARRAPISFASGPDGALERRFVDFVYQPIRDATGAVSGIFVEGSDVTEATLAEAALRASEERQAFLLALGDRLRDLTGPREIMQAAGLLGPQLGADRAGYAEVEDDGEVFTVGRDWCAPGMPSLAGRHRLDDFGPALIAELRAGRTVAFEDALAGPLTPGEAVVATYREASTRAAITVPLLKDGRFAAALYVHGREPRCWTGADEALVCEVAERTWAAVERARAEAMLRDSEGRFRGALEIETVGVIFFDTAGDITDANDAFLQMSGFSREDLAVGDRLRLDVLTPPEWMPHSLQAIADLKANGSTKPYEKEYFRKDGSRFWGLFAAKALDGAQGVEFILDVTERKAVEAGLEDTERRLRTLVEGMPQLVWRAVGAGEWTWASPQWTSYTGISVEASRGKGWLDALHPGDRPGALAAWRGAEADGLFHLDCRIRHASSGHYHWFQSRGTPVRDEGGAILEWIGTSTDIDDQMQARAVLARSGEELEARVAARTAELQQALATLHGEVREREQAEEQLRQGEKLKAIGQLTGGIAHDFNNMLQAITSGLGMIRSRVQQGRTGNVVDYIDRAEKGARRAATLTHRLLAFSRQQALAPEPVSLDRIARGMEDMVRRTVGPAVQVELKLADGKWQVMCDPNQMESALLNLCVNARDAMPEGGWLTISTGELALSEAELSNFDDARPGPYAALAVSDTGTGMPPDVVAHAFEPFFTTKPLGQGTGLGLSQIYGFVRQSGGIVQIDTAPGKGTTVRLCLPLHTQDPDSDAEPAPDTSRTVLLVEDEPDVRELTSEQLRDLGYRVLEAENGAAALRLVQAGTHIDVLVSDIGLPGGMNGRQVAERGTPAAPRPAGDPDDRLRCRRADGGHGSAPQAVQARSARGAGEDQAGSGGQPRRSRVIQPYRGTRR